MLNTEKAPALPSHHTTPSHKCDELPLQQEAIQLPTLGTFTSEVSPSLNKMFFLPLCCPPPPPHPCLHMFPPPTPSLQKVKIFTECHKQGKISNTPKGTVGLSIQLWRIYPVCVKKQHPGPRRRKEATDQKKQKQWLHKHPLKSCHSLP